MDNQPYQPPGSDIASDNKENHKKTLSQSSGKRKIIIALPISIISAGLAYLGIAADITKMISIIMAAYAVVGIIEVIGGNNLVALTKSWNTMPGWKQNIFSIIIIFSLIAVVVVLGPIIAKYL